MAVYSGQKTVAVAGSAERLASDQPVNGAVQVRALPGNTGTVYLGNAGGDVSPTSGMPLAPGDAVDFTWVGNLSELWLDAATSRLRGNYSFSVAFFRCNASRIKYYPMICISKMSRCQPESLISMQPVPVSVQREKGHVRTAH